MNFNSRTYNHTDAEDKKSWNYKFSSWSWDNTLLLFHYQHKFTTLSAYVNSSCRLTVCRDKLHPQSTIKSIWILSNNLFSARLQSADRLRQLSYQNTDARVLCLIRNILSPERESHALLLSNFMPLIQDLIVFVKHGIQISFARIRRYRNFIVVKEIECSNFFRDSVKLRCHKFKE